MYTVMHTNAYLIRRTVILNFVGSALLLLRFIHTALPCTQSFMTLPMRTLPDVAIRSSGDQRSLSQTSTFCQSSEPFRLIETSSSNVASSLHFFLWLVVQCWPLELLTLMNGSHLSGRFLTSWTRSFYIFIFFFFERHDRGRRHQAQREATSLSERYLLLVPFRVAPGQAALVTWLVVLIWVHMHRVTTTPTKSHWSWSNAKYLAGLFLCRLNLTSVSSVVWALAKLTKVIKHKCNCGGPKF